MRGFGVAAADRWPVESWCRTARKEAIERGKSDEPLGTLDPNLVGANSFCRHFIPRWVPLCRGAHAHLIAHATSLSRSFAP